ncbi:MAG: type II toxin-antitoxin system VapC family toxin [Gemmataceae bacterium]|nr:type II toxin-antitoxin system VapC family toxin [Gemmataceae bacterium]
MRVLVDSGVLLRLLNRADPLHADIRGAVRRLKARGDELLTTAQNIAEFWNVATRPPAARGGYGLSIAETEHRLRVIERLFSVLTESPTSYTIWRNLVPTLAVQGVQVHDARLAALAQAHGITQILTLNVADFLRYQPLLVAVHPQTVP